MQFWIVLRCIFSIILFFKVVSRLSLQRYWVNLAIVETFCGSQIEFEVCKSNEKHFTENSTEGLCNTCNFTAVGKAKIRSTLKWSLFELEFSDLNEGFKYLHSAMGGSTFLIQSERKLSFQFLKIYIGAFLIYYETTSFSAGCTLTVVFFFSLIKMVQKMIIITQHMW